MLDVILDRLALRKLFVLDHLNQESLNFLNLGASSKEPGQNDPFHKYQQTNSLVSRAIFRIALRATRVVLFGGGYPGASRAPCW